MVKFTLKLANIPIGVSSSFEATKDFCKDYLTDENPKVFVSLSQKDIEIERNINAKQMEKEHFSQSDFSDEYIETLALYRKIAEELLCFNALVFHGCVIAKDNKAYIFTAKSGTGKTTHANLWLKNVPNCHILNGDKPLLLFKDNSVFACGTPWMGKEKQGKNEILPVNGICILERDVKNHIEKIPFCEAFPLLLSQTHCPNKNDSQLNTVKLIKKAESVNIYRLGCNTDNDAAIVSYRAITLSSYEQELYEKGYLYWKTVGISMLPIIREGKDTVLIKKRPNERLNKYDVVLFSRPNKTGRGHYVLHRIIKVLPNGRYFIVGDNSRFGEIVEEDNIIGVLDTVIRKNGKKLSNKNISYKIYVYFWCRLFPFRCFILKFIKHPKRALLKPFKIFKLKR